MIKYVSFFCAIYCSTSGVFKILLIDLFSSSPVNLMFGYDMYNV